MHPYYRGYKGMRTFATAFIRGDLGEARVVMEYHRSLPLFFFVAEQLSSNDEKLNNAR